MALPPGLNPKQVSLGIASFADGSLASGRATISMPVNVVHTPSNRPIFSSDMTLPFVDGAVTFNLLPTDAPGLNNVSWAYKLKVEISGATTQPEVLYFTLPTAGPDIVDLDGLVTVPSSAGVPISVDVLSKGDFGPSLLTELNNSSSATSVALRAAFVPRSEYVAGSGGGGTVAAAATGLTNFDMLQPIAGHTAAPGGNSTVSDGTQTVTTYVTAHTVVDDATSISLVFANWYVDASLGEVANPNPVTYAGSIQLPDGSLVQCTWRGAPTITVAPGADTPACDQIYCELTRGQVVYVRAAPSVTAAGMVWPLGSQTKSPGGVYNAGSGLVNNTDATMTANPTLVLQGNQSCGPSMILGRTKIARRPIVAILGSSTAWGWNDDDDMYGYSERGCMAQRAPFVKVAKPAEKGATFIGSLGARRRTLKMLAGCTHALLAFGPNDIGTGSATFASVAGMVLSTASLLKGVGVQRVYWSTLFPRTTSDDSGATVQNQSVTTVTNMQTVRTQMNAWARGGFPVDSSGNPVTAGTAGSSPSQLIAGLVEVANTVETGQDSKVWQAAYYSDGTHPNGPGHAAAAAAVPTFKLDAPDVLPTITAATPAKTPPGKPTGLVLIPSANTLAATWTAPVNNWGDPITNYVVQYRIAAASNGGTAGVWQNVTRTASTTASQSITGLVSGTTYDVQVAAVNAQGTGSYGLSASQTPSAAAAPTGPNALTGIQAWYDPAAVAAAGGTDGSAVSTWLDKSSGATYPAGQATAASKPTYRATGINSQPALQFDGGDFLTSSLPGGGPSFTVIFTMQSVAATTGNRDILGGSAANGRVIRLQGSTYDQLVAVNEGTALMATQTIATDAQARAKVYTVTYDAAGGVNNIKMRRNGVDLAITAGNNVAALATTGVTTVIGAEGTGTNLFNGFLGDIVQCSGVLSAAEIATEESRQATKYGITLGAA